MPLLSAGFSQFPPFLEMDMIGCLVQRRAGRAWLPDGHSGPIDPFTKPGMCEIGSNLTVKEYRFGKGQEKGDGDERPWELVVLIPEVPFLWLWFVTQSANMLRLDLAWSTYQEFLSAEWESEISTSGPWKIIFLEDKIKITFAFHRNCSWLILKYFFF